ncbi:hypothetical protein RDI58_025780 [Solanum bulbocastanum]
MSQLL